jgi:hypothetical protein
LNKFFKILVAFFGALLGKARTNRKQRSVAIPAEASPQLEHAVDLPKPKQQIDVAAGSKSIEPSIEAAPTPTEVQRIIDAATRDEGSAAAEVEAAAPTQTEVQRIIDAAAHDEGSSAAEIEAVSLEDTEKANAGNAQAPTAPVEQAKLVEENPNIPEAETSTEEPAPAAQAADIANVQKSSLEKHRLDPVPVGAGWDSFSERARSIAGNDEKSPSEPTVVTSFADGPSTTPRVGVRSLATRGERTPSTAIDNSPYTGPGAELPLPVSYTYWNRLLALRFVENAAQSQIHLAISPRALASIMSEDRGERISPDRAETDFVAAVSEAYAKHVLGFPARLKVFRRYSSDGSPLCIAMLALSVLAAHKMHSDEISSSAAYYIRLAELLNVPRDASDRPKDFRTLEFESLWTFFAAWVSKRTRSSLALPDSDDQRRFIAYPLAHVPLRQLDLEKLPEFFDWAGYSPEKRVTSARIADDLQRWQQSYDRLSQAGNTALRDERSTAVLAQVTSELRAWDGTVTTTQGTRSVQAEILLDAVMRRLGLFLLVPRREGFPPVFRTAQVELNATDSWYEPVELGPDESGTLLNGMTWVHEQNPSYVVRRPPSKAVVLAPNPEYSGFISRQDLPKDTSCAVLCHDSIVDVVTAYLREVCANAPSPILPRGFPADWRLFQNVRAVRQHEQVPEECEGLTVAAYADIIPQGGLRLASLWSWMVGFPPKILIEGRDGRQVYVNDAPVAVDEDGYLNATGVMDAAGSYTVRVGSVERTIRMAEPNLRPPGPGVASSFAEGEKPRYPVVLRTGAWILIGPRPNLILSVNSAGIADSLVLCDFEPAWAIRVGAGRGANAIQLSAARVDVAAKTTSGASTRWISAIYSAAIRHPDLSTEIGTVPAELRQCWMEYVAAARRLKRQQRPR